MAVTIANKIENHRGVYCEVTGDGSTTAIVINHGRGIFDGTMTAQAFAVTAPTVIKECKSGRGGFIFPSDGTPVTISSVSITKTTLTVNTQSAIGNGTKAYVSVIFDQYTSTN